MQAVIMAGGMGTRLAAITQGALPKPMAPVLARPILEHQIEAIKKYGITDIILIVGHMREIIINHFGDGSKFGVNIRYVEEEQPLGTAGGLYYIKELVKDDFFLIYGDNIFDIDLNRMMKFHKDKRATITMLIKPNSHPYDGDLFFYDSACRVNSFSPKNEPREGYYLNSVNLAFYVFSPNMLKHIESPIKLDMEKDVIVPNLAEEEVFAYLTSEYIEDVGTAPRIATASIDLFSGVVAARNISNKRSVLLVDSENVVFNFLNDEANIHMVEVNKDIAKFLREFNKSKYVVQVGINLTSYQNRGFSEDDVLALQRKLDTTLGVEGAYFDGYTLFDEGEEIKLPYPAEITMINSKTELDKIGDSVKAENRKNILDFHKSNGVEFEDEASVTIAPTVHIGKGTKLGKNNTIVGGSIIGKNVILKANNHIEDSIVEEGNVLDGVRLEKTRM